MLKGSDRIFANQLYNFVFKMAKTIFKDCNKLLTNYEKNATEGKWEFSEFANEWREMRFELIFSGRQHLAELPNFCRSLFHIAKKFIFHPSSGQTKRMGALFLCYGLYEKQPLKMKMKLRLTLDELKMLWSLVQSDTNLDPLFIFCKMFVENAFHFCATSRDFTQLRLKPAESKQVAPQPMNSIPESQLIEFVEQINSWNLPQLNQFENLLFQ